MLDRRRHSYLYSVQCRGMIHLHSNRQQNQSNPHISDATLGTSRESRYTYPIARHELLDRRHIVAHKLQHGLVLRQQPCACGRIPLRQRRSVSPLFICKTARAEGQKGRKGESTHSAAVTESRTYARSRYSSATTIPKSVASMPNRSRSALVVYSRTSSSKLRVDMEEGSKAVILVAAQPNAICSTNRRPILLRSRHLPATEVIATLVRLVGPGYVMLLYNSKRGYPAEPVNIK